jgi:ferredoxin
VLTHDRVSAGIDSATCITTGQCYCRHKMQHLGLACDAPMDVCLTFNQVARYLADYGIAREISKEEAHRIVRQCMDHGLMQIGDNTRSGLAVICNCCGCCCDLLLGYRRFGATGLVSPSAFVAAIASSGCDGCGVCVERCPVRAIAPRAPGDPRTPQVSPSVCLGCGICARFCPTGACHLVNRVERPEVPLDLVEKIALAAIDVGKVGNYVFDDQQSPVHAVLRRLVNLAVQVPPIKHLLLWPPVRERMIAAVRGAGFVTRAPGVGDT